MHLHFLQYLQQQLQENPTVTIADLMQNYKVQHPNFELISEDFIRMQLYGSIVVPWERLKKSLPKKMLMSQLNYEDWGYFKILNNNGTIALHRMDLRFFLRKLRNAISHDQVRIYEDFNVVFRDSDGSKIKYKWEELVKLMEQLEKLN